MVYLYGHAIAHIVNGGSLPLTACLQLHSHRVPSSFSFGFFLISTEAANLQLLPFFQFRLGCPRCNPTLIASLGHLYRVWLHHGILWCLKSLCQTPPLSYYIFPPFPLPFFSFFFSSSSSFQPLPSWSPLAFPFSPLVVC